MSRAQLVAEFSIHRDVVGIVVALIALTLLQGSPVVAAPWNSAISETMEKPTKRLLVLLIGNSHVLMPGFTKRLVRSIEEKSALGRDVRTRTIAKIGTTLTKTRQELETKRVLASADWDIVVLQESTTAFMTAHGRRNFMTAVRWFREHKPAGAKLLLWQAWPQRAGHALYHRRGVWGKWFKKPPRSPKQLFSWIKMTSKQTADANMLIISPIGSCWMRLPPRKRPYSRDRYHASIKGLTFIADVLGRSIVATVDGDVASGIKEACP